MTRLTIALACFLTGLAASRADLSVGISTGATNITATSAWLQASVTATGAATPYLFAFWAKTNFSTNLTWTYTNAFGESTVGVYSVQATGLERGTMYHYRTYATNTTTSAWSSVGYTFRTLSSTTPTPLDAYSVTAKSNGDLLGPTNFFFANSQEIARAAGAGGALTNEPLWSAESNNLAQATNSLNDRVGANYTNNEATSNRAEAIYNDLTGRVAIVSNRTDALQAATNDLNVRLEAATNSNAATSNRAESIYNDLTGRVAIVSNRTDDLQAATNDLNARLEAATNNNAATSNQAEAIYSDLTGRVAIVSNRTDALQNATNSLNDRAKALEDATNLLNAATNNLNTRLTTVEGTGGTNWSLYAAKQNVNLDGNSLSNVSIITAPVAGFSVLAEEFTNNVFESGAWTNVAGAGWEQDDTYIQASANESMCSNTTAAIEAGRAYRCVLDAQYGWGGAHSNHLIMAIGGESIIFTNATLARIITTNDIAAVRDARPTLANQYDEERVVIVYSLVITDITYSNSVSIPRLSSTNFVLNGVDMGDSTNSMTERIKSMEGNTSAWNQGAASWSGYAATQNVNFASHDLTNVAAIRTGTEVTIGNGANGSNGTGVGKSANGADSGCAGGNTASGQNSGAAWGHYADGNGSGAAFGRQANGNTFGAAFGRESDGHDKGVAVGAGANGPKTNIVVGAYSTATGGPNRVVIGYMTTNLIDNSVRLRGALYLDGGSSISIRPTFGGGDFVTMTIQTSTWVYLDSETNLATNTIVFFGPPQE